MRFGDAKRRVVYCLDRGAFDSEYRDAMAENNLLATGQITVAEVKRLIGRCWGPQYSAKPMTEDSTTMKHEFKPSWMASSGLSGSTLSSARRILRCSSAYTSPGSGGPSAVRSAHHTGACVDDDDRF